MSLEHLVVLIAVGLVAGWIAGRLVRGKGFGLVGDIVVGVLGAFIADWLLPRLGVHLGAGLLGQIINATIGAVILVAVLRLVRRG